MYHQRNKKWSALIAVLACMATCFSAENIIFPDISNILFDRGWGRNIRIAVDKGKDVNKTDPVVIIYKDSGVTSSDDRVILITPIFKSGTEEIGVDPIVSSFKVSVVNPENEFEIVSADIQGDRVKEIESLWLLCSDIVVSVGKEDQKLPDAGLLEEPTKHYVFSTFRSKSGTIFFSEHMAAMVQKPPRGSKSQQLVIACDKLISAILPID